MGEEEFENGFKAQKAETGTLSESEDPVLFPVSTACDLPEYGKLCHFVPWCAVCQPSFAVRARAAVSDHTFPE